MARDVEEHSDLGAFWPIRIGFKAKTQHAWTLKGVATGREDWNRTELHDPCTKGLLHLAYNRGDEDPFVV